ncbi:hypothetical protein Ddye_021422, partial [Dipteronia dyeriana]
VTGGLAAALLLWPKITKHFHLSHNVHKNLETTCPTAKTGLLGGADSPRENYLDDLTSDGKGVDTAAYDEAEHLKDSA